MTDILVPFGFGLLAGAVVVLLLCWRRITAPSWAEDALRLWADLELAHEQLAEARRQVREQFSRADRMAHLYARAMDRKGA